MANTTRYRIAIHVDVVSPDAPLGMDASGNELGATMRLISDVSDPTPTVKANGAAGLLMVMLRDMLNGTLSTDAAERLIDRLQLDLELRRR